MTVRARCVLEDVTNTVTGAPGKACEDVTNTLPDAAGKESEVDVSGPPYPTCTHNLDCNTGSSCSRLDARHLPEQVASCAGELCRLWARCAADSAAAMVGGGDGTFFYATNCMHVILQRFSRMGPPGFARALLNPPPAVPPPLSRAEPCQPASAGPCCGSMAESLGSRWQSLGSFPDLCADAALQDLVFRVLLASHQESESHLPNVESMLIGISSQERDKILFWLLQVCDLRNLSDSVFYMAVLLFDRFCATAVEPIPTGRLHLTVLAILSTAMKVIGGADDTRKPWKLRELLACLGQQQFSVEEVFREEVNLLSALDFEVSAPCPVDFLDALVLPFTQPDRPEASSPVVILAKFLLQLSLVDTSLHYLYPHAVLAAGAVYVALWCTRAKPERVAALLEDAAAACGDSEGAAEEAAAAEAAAAAREAVGARPAQPLRTADPGSGGRRSSLDAKGGHTARALRRL